MSLYLKIAQIVQTDDINIKDINLCKKRYGYIYLTAFLLLALQLNRYSKATFKIKRVLVIPCWWRRGESNPGPKTRHKTFYECILCSTFPLITRHKQPVIFSSFIFHGVFKALHTHVHH